ncbi:MAG: TonB-dependent receptor, partial [Pseudomonadota bacterium]
RAGRRAEVLFEVKNWTVANPSNPDRLAVDDVSFKVRAGEIVGISGLMGAGRTELAMSIFGRTYGKHAGGNVLLEGKEVDTANVPAAVDAGFFSFTAGEARSRGVEIDANLSTDSGVDLWFSYAYTDAEFTNSNPDADFGAQIDAGDQLINSPEHQISLQVSKAFNVSDRAATIGGGVLYVGERVGWTGFDFNLPSYTTTRLFGEIEAVDGLLVRLDIDNLFDETFYTNSFADVWVEPGAPRRFRLSAAYKF